MTEEIIYSRGEVSQLLKATIEHLRDMDFGVERDAIDDLMDALNTVARKYQTMSQTYLRVLLVKRKNRNFLGDSRSASYKKDHETSMEEILRVLFLEDLGKMPLLMNNPMVGCVALFRLRVGR
jgi:hypothetical protein